MNPEEKIGNYLWHLNDDIAVLFELFEKYPKLFTSKEFRDLAMSKDDLEDLMVDIRKALEER